MGRPRKVGAGIGERIASLIEVGEKQAEFAKRLGFPETTIGNYVRGNRAPTADFLSRLREKTGADINWIVTGEATVSGATQLLTSHSPKGMVAIPRYAVQASAGGGAVAIEEEVADFFYVNPDWLASIAPKGARLGMLSGRGDSMEPTISDGDVLIVTFDVNRQDLAAGGVFVFTYEGDIYLKRLSLALDGSVQVISDNPSYPMQTIPAEVAEAKLEINARVIWAGGRLR